MMMGRIAGTGGKKRGGRNSWVSAGDGSCRRYGIAPETWRITCLAYIPIEIGLDCHKPYKFIAFYMRFSPSCTATRIFCAALSSPYIPFLIPVVSRRKE
jgi:hypothetical protein